MVFALKFTRHSVPDKHLMTFNTLNDVILPGCFQNFLHSLNESSPDIVNNRFLITALVTTLFFITSYKLRLVRSEKKNYMLFCSFISSLSRTRFGC